MPYHYHGFHYHSFYNHKEQNLDISVFLNVLVSVSKGIGVIISGSFSLLLDAFGINHVNLQLEYDKCDSKNIIVQY